MWTWKWKCHDARYKSSTVHVRRNDPPPHITLLQGVSPHITLLQGVFDSLNKHLAARRLIKIPFKFFQVVSSHNTLLQGIHWHLAARYPILLSFDIPKFLWFWTPCSPPKNERRTVEKHIFFLLYCRHSSNIPLVRCAEFWEKLCTWGKRGGHPKKSVYRYLTSASNNTTYNIFVVRPAWCLRRKSKSLLVVACRLAALQKPSSQVSHALRNSRRKKRRRESLPTFFLSGKRGETMFGTSTL